MNRRSFLHTSTLASGSLLMKGCASMGSGPDGIIDTHTHFYDPTRPEGVPWPDRGDPVLYRTILPDEFIRLVQPLGVTGTVVVEASPWVQDNDWLLRLADAQPFLLGIVGHLRPSDPQFHAQLDRLARHRLYRGIRIGSDELDHALRPGSAQDSLRHLADLNLSLDLLIPPERLPDAARLSTLIPSLRIVVDHCANVPVGPTPPGEWTGGLAACHYTPNVFMKVSGLVEGTGRRGGQAPSDSAIYQPILDALWHPFGEDRLIYGSNWPVSLLFAPYTTVLQIVKDYFATKGPRATAKYFRRNAVRVYQLARR